MSDGNDPARVLLGPDLHAGELHAMARLLSEMSGDLARRALAVADLMVECQRAAGELRTLGATEGEGVRDRLLALSVRLGAAAQKCR